MSQIQGPHMNARNGAAIPKYLFFHVATWSTSTTLKFQNLAPAHVVQQSLEWPLPHIGSQRCFDPKNKLLEAVEECLSNHEGGGAAMMSACNTVWVWSQKFSYWVLPLSRSSPGELVTFPLHIGTTSEAEVNTEEVRLQLNLIFLVGNKYVFYCFFLLFWEIHIAICTRRATEDYLSTNQQACPTATVRTTLGSIPALLGPFLATDELKTPSNCVSITSERVFVEGA